jgi:hypothetical protein
MPPQPLHNTRRSGHHELLSVFARHGAGLDRPAGAEARAARPPIQRLADGVTAYGLFGA